MKAVQVSHELVCDFCDFIYSLKMSSELAKIFKDSLRKVGDNEGRVVAHFYELHFMTVKPY